MLGQGDKFGKEGASSVAGSVDQPGTAGYAIGLLLALTYAS